MRYEAYAYRYPARPEVAAPPDLIPFYASRGYHGQVKKNGTCTVIFSRGDEVRFRTRHGDEEHRAWSPMPEHVRAFAGREQWNVYVAELLHSKVRGGVRNHLYLFDILVSDGEELTGWSHAARQCLLEGRFPKAGNGIGHLGMVPVGPHLSRAWNYMPGTDYKRLWDAMGAEDEGLVLKDPRTLLYPCVSAGANAFGQVKFRRASKKYSF